MSISEQEQKDLDAAKAEVSKIESSTYDYMKSMLRYTPRDLETSGYRGRTVAQAIESVLKDAEKKIENIWKAHVRKYPDA